MNYKIDYLLRYVSNDTYKKIIVNKNDYVLRLCESNYVDTDLNIRYLIILLISRFIKLFSNLTIIRIKISL